MSISEKSPLRLVTPEGNKMGMAQRIKNQGMNWIRLSTRMAIYHRDGFVCAYCGEGAEETGRRIRRLTAKKLDRKEGLRLAALRKG